MFVKTLFPERQRKSPWLSLVSVLFATLLLGSAPAAFSQPGAAAELFGDAGYTSADAAWEQPTHVLRSRMVSVDLGLLLDTAGNARDLSAQPEILLNLFADASFVGRLDRIERETGTSWIGTLKDASNGYFYLVLVDGVFIAHVASSQGVYEVSWAGDKRYRVIQIDQSQLGECPEETAEAPVFDLLPQGLAPAADSGDTIDVMVVYTAAARAGEGNHAAMKARIALAMTETNAGYANSGVVPRLRLVHVQQVSYTESGDIVTDRDRLVHPSDGHMDNVHGLRNFYGADMVALVVENGGGYCGIAAAIMANGASAFQVTRRSGCMTGYYSFGHEFGHLQGARHDTYVDPSATPFTYGHGHVNTANRWRTVMAYNNLCADTPPGTSCTRLQWWSNPTKTWIASPMGVVGTSENYKVLNTTATTVANFRSAKIGEDFVSSFNTNHMGWAPVYGSWGHVNARFYRTLGVKNASSSIRHVGRYGDLDFRAQVKRSGCVNCANQLIIRGNSRNLTSMKSWYPSYVFQYSNSGQYSIGLFDSSGTSSFVQGWTTSPAIAIAGWNKLRVVAVGPRLRFYINGSLVWTGVDTSFRAGQVGIGMYRDASSTGNVFLINSASLNNAPTLDLLADEEVLPGTVVPGGSCDQSPGLL